MNILFFYILSESPSLRKEINKTPTSVTVVEWSSVSDSVDSSAVVVESGPNENASVTVIGEITGVVASNMDADDDSDTIGGSPVVVITS